MFFIENTPLQRRNPSNSRFSDSATPFTGFRSSIMSTDSKLRTVAFRFEVCDTASELQRDYQVFQDQWYTDAMKQCNIDISSSDAYKTSVNCVALRCSELDDVYFLLSCVSQRLNRKQTNIQESMMNAKVYDTSKQLFNINMRDLPPQVRNFFSKNNTNPVTVAGQWALTG